MAYTQTDLDAVRKAKIAPEKAVTFSDGRRVEFKSNADLTAVEAEIVRALAAASGTRRVRQYRIRTSKGL